MRHPSNIRPLDSVERTQVGKDRIAVTGTTLRGTGREIVTTYVTIEDAVRVLAGTTAGRAAMAAALSAYHTTMHQLAQLPRKGES